MAGLQLGQGRRCERLGPGEIRRSLLDAPGRGERRARASQTTGSSGRESIAALNSASPFSGSPIR